MLDGYGPIPPSMARRLVADGAESFHRVLTDPRDGAALEIGRSSYRVTKAQRQWLRLRDGKCPFPGCSNHSLDNEADHLLAWAHGGTTGISNLGQPCRKHHALRHTTGWTPTAATKNEPPGWTSPTGRHYTSEHPDWEPPHWPKQQPGRWTVLAPTPGQGVPEDEIPDGRLEVDPFPELHRADDLQLPNNELPDNEPPDNEPPDNEPFSDDTVPDGPMPEDPYPNWAFSLPAHSIV
jgi:hypothetical protein